MSNIENNFYQKQSDIFITGTDTGVGKTFVSGILCKKFGYEYFKPIQSGTIEQTDTEFIASQGIRTHREVYRLTQPLSPQLSAKIDGITIDVNKIIRPKTEKSLIIEGAGGVMLPINEKEMMIDVIKKLQIPTIIVTRSTLGTINHTLLTIKALRDYEIPILGVVMNNGYNEENARAIEEFGMVKMMRIVDKENLP